MDVVKHVDIKMIEIFSMGVLAIVDIRKREISALAMLGIMVVLLYPGWKSGCFDFHGMLVGGFLIGISILSHQVLGLADAFILFGLGLRYGSLTLLDILLCSTLLLSCFHFVWNVVRGKEEGEYPFLPFIMLAYMMER